mmetsp:Transcript_11593/g.34356  ORF Transcript_11593/g.34356 Transcript_11593/m.34356 type:complete len:296 (+) Transcript_11593:231-1118(+)
MHEIGPDTSSIVRLCALVARLAVRRDEELIVKQCAPRAQEDAEQDVPQAIRRPVPVRDALRLAHHLVRRVRLLARNRQGLAVLSEAEGDGARAHAQVDDDVRFGALDAVEVEDEGTRLLLQRPRDERVPRHVHRHRRVRHLNGGPVHGERRVPAIHQVKGVGRRTRADDGHVFGRVVGLGGRAVLHRVRVPVPGDPGAEGHVEAWDFAHGALLDIGEGRLVPGPQRHGDGEHGGAGLHAVVLDDEGHGLLRRGLGRAALGRGARERDAHDAVARLHGRPLEVLLVVCAHLQIEDG